MFVIIHVVTIIIILTILRRLIKALVIRIRIMNFERKYKSRLLFIIDKDKRWKYKLSTLFVQKYIIDIDECNKFQYWLDEVTNDNIYRIDIVLQSTGGLIIANDVIISNLMTFKGIINTYIPFYGHSAASLIALTGHNLYMNNHSVMGPVDPMHSDKNEDYSIHALIELSADKNREPPDQETAIKITDGKKLYDDNIEMLKKIFNRKKITEKKIIKLIDEFGSGKYPHDKIFSYEYVKSLGLKINYPVPREINEMTRNLLQ
jgi:hypothetical protein